MSIIFEHDPFLFPQSVFDDFIKTKKFTERTGFPVYDIIQEKEHVAIEYALAGFTSKQLHVWTEGTKLCVSGEELKDRKKNRRITTKSFNTIFEAKGLDLENIKVSFVNGILRVEVPRLNKQPEKQYFDIVTDSKLLK